MFRGQLFVERLTGRRVKIEEVLETGPADKREVRYRLSGGTRFLTAAQVLRENVQINVRETVSE